MKKKEKILVEKKRFGKSFFGLGESLDQVRSGQVRSVQVRSGQVRSAARSGQKAMSAIKLVSSGQQACMLAS